MTNTPVIQRPRSFHQAVIVQGVLGGLRVILISDGTTMAIIHGCLAQAFFSLTVSLALFTSQGWRREPEQIPFAESILSEAEGLRASAHVFCAVTEGCGDGRIEEKRTALLLSVTGPA